MRHNIVESHKNYLNLLHLNANVTAGNCGKSWLELATDNYRYIKGSLIH